MIPFLREREYREYIKYKFIKTTERVVFIQNKFRNSMEIIKAKLTALKMLWEKEKNQILFHIDKKESQEMKTFARNLRSINEAVVEKMLNRWLESCMHVHALAFF